MRGRKCVRTRFRARTVDPAGLGPLVPLKGPRAALLRFLVRAAVDATLAQAGRYRGRP